MATGDRKDPYRSYNFLVEIDGITRAGFRECSGLDASQDPIDYREGTDALTARKLPGLVKYANITLKWGMTDDAELWDWRQEGDRRQGRAQERLDRPARRRRATEKLRWNFREALADQVDRPELQRDRQRGRDRDARDRPRRG